MIPMSMRPPRDSAHTAAHSALRSAGDRRFPRLAAMLPAAVVSAVCALFATVAGPAEAVPAVGPEPVAKVDLNRYLGGWNQLAAIPQPFNLVCARDTRADYSPAGNGEVRVRNTCTTWAGTLNRIEGRARVLDEQTGAQLRVRFPGVPNQGAADGPPNYVIVGLDPDYKWAVVTNPTRTSGFVLSRSTALTSGEWHEVRAAIAAAGESACLYLTSPTTGGFAETVPLCTVRR